MVFILENFHREKETERVNLYGTMDKYLTVTGLMAKKMALEFGNHRKAIFMKVNGQIIDRKVKDVLFMVDLAIKAILKTFLSTVRVKKNFLMETDILDSIKKENPMVREDIFGLIKMFIKGNSMKALGKEKEKC
jgi:hypothetical protein